MSSFSLIRTNASHPEFQNLVDLLDAHLAITDEDEHDFYHQFNGLDDIKYVVLAQGTAGIVACGAVKHYEEGTMEVKRMYTLPDYRGRGIAAQVLDELEAWSLELGYTRCLLETGVRQPYAIRLYEKQGYQRMPDNYGQYQGVENSVCLDKKLQ